MTVQMVIVNAQQQPRLVNLAKGEQLLVNRGDSIRLSSKTDIKTLRKGNDLVIKNANGEEFVLKDFYAKSENLEDKQLFSWDDPLGQEKEIFSHQHADTMQVAVNNTGTTTDVGGASTDNSSSNNATPDNNQQVVESGGDSRAGGVLALLGFGGVVAGVAASNSSGGHSSNPPSS